MKNVAFKIRIFMRNLLLPIFACLFNFFLITACAGEAASNMIVGQVADNESGETAGGAMRTINIQVGDKVFTATLANNSAAKAFVERMPMTVNMDDMNANEKYYYLSGFLPTQSSSAGQIRSGDLMLYGSNCVVLFYKSFFSLYSYTKLGSMDDASGLAAALGNGSAVVSFSLKE